MALHSRSVSRPDRLGRSRHHALMVVIVLLLVLLVYWPGLRGGFMFDDFHNLTENQDLQAVNGWNWRALADAAWSSESGMFKRPVSMLSFAINHALWGMSPYAFKLVNLLIHVVNAWLVWRLASLWVRAPIGGQRAAHASSSSDGAASLLNVDLRQPAVGTCTLTSWIPVIALAFWALNPLQLTSVLYVVQRMASLATTFVLAGMLFYAWGRQRQCQGQGGGWWRIAIAYGVCLPLAVLSKENGALLLPLLGWMEWCLYRGRGLVGRGLASLWGIHATTVLVPALLALLLLIVRPEFFVGGYAGRDFSVYERLLTQARMLWTYTGWFLLPRLGELGLHHDDIARSTSWLSPWTTLPAVLSLGALLLALLVKRSGSRWWLAVRFGAGVFLLGHALESSIFPLEMVHEHRNYLPTVGLAFALACCAAWGTDALQTRQRVRSSGATAAVVGTGAVALLLVVSAWLTWQRSNDWSNNMRRASVDAMAHPNSPRAQVEYAGWLQSQGLEDPDISRRQAMLQEARRRYAHVAELERYALVPQINLLAVENQLGMQAAEQTLKLLEARLQTPPLSPATTTVLHAFVECNNTGGCTFETNDVLRLVHALTQNPYLDAFQASRLYAVVTNLLIARGDIGTAMAYAQEAVKTTPANVQARLNFAKLLLEMGERAGAQSHLRAVRDLPMTINERKRFSELEQQIRQAH